MALRHTGTVRGFVAVVVVVVFTSATPLWAGPVYMPPGSTVWMKFQGTAVPGTDSDDIVGSTLPGLAPPNGIPLTTVGDGTSTATGYAEILPTQVRTFLSSPTSARMWASFQDTYIVGGSASGPFDITFQLSVAGIMRSQPGGPFHQLVGANVSAEIGTFAPDSDAGGVPLNEQFRITPFPDQTSAGATYVHPTDSRSTPFSVEFSTSATYTKTGVNVGDAIVIAYGVNSAFSRGEIDLLNTAVITFTTPAGVRQRPFIGPLPLALIVFDAHVHPRAVDPRARVPLPAGPGRLRRPPPPARIRTDRRRPASSNGRRPASPTARSHRRDLSMIGDRSDRRLNARRRCRWTGGKRRRFTRFMAS